MLFSAKQDSVNKGACEHNADLWAVPLRDTSWKECRKRSFNVTDCSSWWHNIMAEAQCPVRDKWARQRHGTAASPKHREGTNRGEVLDRIYLVIFSCVTLPESASRTRSPPVHWGWARFSHRFKDTWNILYIDFSLAGSGLPDRHPERAKDAW